MSIARCLPRYSLRTLIVACGLSAVVFAVAQRWISSTLMQRRMLAEFASQNQSKGVIQIAYEGSNDLESPATRPFWFDATHSVVGVSFHNSELTRRSLLKLAALNAVQSLHAEHSYIDESDEHLLAQMRHLQFLSLDFTPADAVIHKLAKGSNLERIRIPTWRLSSDCDQLVKQINRRVSTVMDPCANSEP